MRIFIITIHSIHNFGSIFQALALQEYFKEHGQSVEIIDYRPDYNLVGKRKLRTLIGKMLNIKSYTLKKRKFDDFIKEQMVLTKRCCNHDQLKSLFSSIEDAVFVVGGDQLWNPFHYCGNDRAFRLSFVNAKCRKVSYGTSLGKGTFTKEEIFPLITDIADFKYVSVRESSSVDLLKEHGLQNVTHVCDPVMLLPVAFYNKFIGDRIIKEKYIFVYLADKSELISRFLNYLKEKYGYKIVHVCGFRKKFESDYYVTDEGPKDVLNLLVNAEIVVSASFHATLFSVLFHKNFFSLLPGVETNNRIIDLLNTLHLQSKIIKDETDFSKLTIPIDYKEIDVYKENYIEKSKKYIEQILEET